jgi:hypothetical protein
MGVQTKGSRHEVGGYGDKARTDVMVGKSAVRDFGETGERDAHYDLISLLYHALQGAETYTRYIQDAEKEGDKELAQFFSGVREEEKLRAKRAKALLGARIGVGRTRRSLEEEEE